MDMKVLVQQSSTGLWYQGPFTWVADALQAWDFANTLQAFDFCARKGMQDVQIVVCGPDQKAPLVITPS